MARIGDVVGFDAVETEWLYRTLMAAMMQGCQGGYEPEAIELRILAKLCAAAAPA